MSQPSAFPDAPTEDRRILDELEQLQQAIRTSRVTRERAEAAFDGELRAFETRRAAAVSRPRGAGARRSRGVRPDGRPLERPGGDHVAEAESLAGRGAVR